VLCICLCVWTAIHAMEHVYEHSICPCNFVYLSITLMVEGSPYSITERRVPKLIPVLGSQPAGDMSHKPGSRLPLLSTRPAVILATLASPGPKLGCTAGRGKCMDRVRLSAGGQVWAEER